MMKKLLFFFPILFFVHFCTAQNVGIGTATPNANAALDISNGSKGLLIPRMDSVSRKAIPNTNGLMVYDTTTKCFWYNDGARWVNMPPKGNATGDVLYWNGAAWAVLPAGTGGQFLSLTPGTLVPAWSTLNGGNISTQNVSNIAPSSAESGGNIISDGGAAITARGVVWSTSPNPTIALSTKTNDGSGVGSFTSNLTGLATGTTYYVRAYATNINGTSYGNQVSFVTNVDFTIGQTYRGGKIFYIDGTGQHGLIVSPEDLSTGIMWDQLFAVSTGATGVAIGEGQVNTFIITATLGNDRSYAASLCSIFYNGGGYGDWFLPSFYELNQLFLKRNAIGITEGIYWSSSEIDQDDAWAVDFSQSGPNQAAFSKWSSWRVRAVRKF